MEEKKLQTLIRRYITGEATQEEWTELQDYISQEKNAERIEVAMEAVLASMGGREAYNARRFDPFLDSILDADKASSPLRVPSPAGEGRTPVRKMNYWRWAAAAAVILIAAISVILSLSKYSNDKAPSKYTAQTKNDIAPGKQGAVLTLSNGKTIVLDTAHNGKLLDNFTKTDESITVESTVIEYATLTTPRARTQALTLSDGSKVWLNAESSIKFPTVFSGKERRVEVTGEAYFEVVHNEKQPFFVSVNGAEIQDIGTSFNVNAYTDEEAMKVTLIEGIVNIKLPSTPRGEGQGVRLKPGQQAQLQTTNYKLQTAKVDVGEVIAWKNGLFSFHSADIQTIMRQVARWYDVEVVFEGKMPDKHYNGETSRNLNASQMLKVLEESGIKFRIEGKKITVMN